MLSENMKPETTGALDMGGASAQISFIPNMTVPQGYSRPVELYGHNYTLYTHSFLCYGINEALRRYRAALVQVRYTVNEALQFYRAALEC